MAKPETGRTHQIRVHLQYLGYPIANDPIYGSWRIFQDVATKGGEILDIESMLNRFYDLIPTVSSTEFENSDSIDYLLACTECKNLRMDPTPDQLLIYLHALKYEGDGWEYETDYPYWADEQYKGDLVLKDRFWKFGGLWDGKSCGEIEG